jgi:hypothetical protein
MDKKDYYYTEMLGMMRQQGAKDNPTTLQLGTMQSANSVKIGDLILNAEDFYTADYLFLDNVERLKSGDIVAVQRLQDTNMYVIVARVV